MKCPHCGAPNHDTARFCGACGRATHGTEPSRAGTGPSAAISAAQEIAGREIAGRYRVLAKLGEGGMGAVYRGEQISLKRKCAIKVLKPELSADAGLVRRFNAEAELVARLSHPNIVNIYDFGQDVDGSLFIAMEYLEGRTLRAVMTADGPLPARRAIAVAAQIAGSLTDAHAHGIVHRDLKPDNVMLTERGKEKDVVRVLDFGIAKLRDEGKNTVAQMTQAGDLVGTPQYMAPEQIRGDRVDGRTDVYALGAMLYEMVTGRLPFEGPTVMAILSKHLTETPPAPSVRRPDLAIPPALDALVMASLAKVADARIASMEEVGERLAAIGVAMGGSPSQPFVVPGQGGGGAWQPGMATQAQPAQPAPYGGAVPSATPPGPMPGPMSEGLRARSPTPGPVPGTTNDAMRARSPTPGPPIAQQVIAQQAIAPPTGQTGTPRHASGTQPPPFARPPSTPDVAPSNRTALWIALAVLAVGGIAVGAILANGGRHAKSSDGSGASGSASGSVTIGSDPWAGNGSATASPDDPWAASGSASGGAPPPAPPPAPDGARYTDPSGWSVTLPDGFAAKPTKSTVNGSELTGFEGHLDGVDAGIGFAAVRGLDPNMSDADAGRAAMDFAKSINGTLFTFDFPTIRGARRLRAIYDVENARLEAVLYSGSPISLVVMFGIERPHFDATEALRRDLFERRVTPP